MTTNAQVALAVAALIALGLLGGALVFHAVPQENRELLSTIVGAIAGALTMGGAIKLVGHPGEPS